MHKLDLNIARLKLLLAEVGARKDSLDATRHQYEEQIERLVRITVHEDAALERSLVMMLDVDTRLQTLARQHHYLEIVRNRARHELESLQLTKLIDETRAQLTRLQQRQREQTGVASMDSEASIASEIRRLEEIITVASGVAARSISEQT